MANCSRAIFRAWSSSWCTFRYTRCLFVSVCWNIDYTASVARNYQVPSPKRASHSRAMIGASGELSRGPNLTIDKQSASLGQLFDEENWVSCAHKEVDARCLRGCSSWAKNWFAFCSTRWPTDTLINLHSFFMFPSVTFTHDQPEQSKLLISVFPERNQFPAILRH